MTDKKKRKKLNLKKMAVRGLFFGIVVYAVCTLANQQASLYKKQKTVAECQTMISDAKGEQARLKEELELVGTDEYKEQKARELLGYIKPDERIYIDVTK